MDVRIKRSVFSGTLDAPPSKSYLHRLLLLSASCGEKTQLCFSGALSEDISATADCITALGGKTEKNGEGILVTPISGDGDAFLDCRESGTTLRLMLPYVSALGRNAVVTGRGRLPSRPNGPLIDALEGHGVSVSGRGLPLTLCGRLTGGDFVLPGNVSSQFVSGLMTALPLTGEDSRISLSSPLESKSYVAMTMEAMKRFSVSVEGTKDGYFVPACKYVSPGRVSVPGDWSNSGALLVMGALGGEMRVRGLSDEVQGDRAIIDILSRFGAECGRDRDAFFARRGKMQGISISADDIPDLVCVLAAAACGAVGRTEISGVSRLRLKESDRIESTVSLVNSLGGRAGFENGSIFIDGTGRLSGGIAESGNDHRIVMAAAAASAICDNDVIIRGAEAIGKSFGEFFDLFAAAGGRYDVI